jgi:hypothetical protein
MFQRISPSHPLPYHSLHYLKLVLMSVVFTRRLLYTEQSSASNSLWPLSHATLLGKQQLSVNSLGETLQLCRQRLAIFMKGR